MSRTLLRKEHLNEHLLNFSTGGRLRFQKSFNSVFKVKGDLSVLHLRLGPGTMVMQLLFVCGAQPFYPNISWDLNAGMSAIDENVQQKIKDTLSHPWVGLENSASSVNFPNGFGGSDALNLCSDIHKLPFKILFFCPPQDPFNLSTPEPLELQISHGPEASLYVLFLFEITIEDKGTTFSSNRPVIYITLCVCY